jgi:CHAT domain-containing protein
LLQESKLIREKELGKKHIDYATSCMCLGLTYFAEKKYQRAIPFFKQAEEIFKAKLGKEYPDYIFVCEDLGNLYWQLHEYKKAFDYYIESMSSQQERENKIFDFTSELEKQFFLNTSVSLMNKFLSFVYKNFSHLNTGFVYQSSISNRNLIVLSSEKLRKTFFNTVDTNAQNKYNEWVALREELSFLLTKPLSLRAGQKALEEKINSLEKELTRLSAAFNAQEKEKKIDWTKIQQKLNPGEAAIEFMEFNFYNGRRWTDSIYYVALLLEKNKPQPAFIPLFEKKQLTKLLSKTGNETRTENIAALYSTDASLSNTNGNNSSRLYQLIWQPLEQKLKGIKKIYFAPAGLLYRISFAALPISKDSVLNDKYHLIQLTNTASVLNQQQYFLTASDTLDLYGGIPYDVDSNVLKKVVAHYHNVNDNTKRSLTPGFSNPETWNYLSGTQREIDSILAISNNKNTFRVFKGINATEESIKALSGESSPSVLHIATHGFFFSSPQKNVTENQQIEVEGGKVFRRAENPLLRSGLLFAGANMAWSGKPMNDVDDGILTAYEVSNLYLPHTKMVVLSACETALGDIQGAEGVFGLQRAFKMAGVRYLVMSLWKVPDSETVEFMKEFYKKLFNNQAIPNAFYDTQIAMRKKYKNEPNKWAAWVLVM